MSSSGKASKRSHGFANMRHHIHEYHRKNNPEMGAQQSSVSRSMVRSPGHLVAHALSTDMVRHAMFCFVNTTGDLRMTVILTMDWLP